MKKTAKLVLLFSVTFTLLFLLSAGLGVLRLWVDAARSVPVRYTIPFLITLPTLERALPFSLYASILLSMSYASRVKAPGLAAFIALFLAAFGFSYAVSLGLSRIADMSAPPLEVRGGTLGKPGLMLTSRGITITLLNEPGDQLGERLVLLPGEKLEFSVPTEDSAPLPPVRFENEGSALLDSLSMDFSLSAKEFSARFAEGRLPYTAFLAAVIFSLLSLASIFDIGAWHLANMFVGAVFFRLLLMFEVFVCGSTVKDYLSNFFGASLPSFLIAPILIGIAGALLAVYSVLVSAVRIPERRERRRG